VTQPNCIRQLAPTHNCIRQFADLSVDHPSCGSVKKFTCVSFFTDTSAHLKISHNISNKVMPINKIGVFF
jgi:hypothetical protein